MPTKFSSVNGIHRSWNNKETRRRLHQLIYQVLIASIFCAATKLDFYQHLEQHTWRVDISIIQLPNILSSTQSTSFLLRVF